MSSGSEKRCDASGRRKRGFSDVDSSSSESSDDEVVGAKPRRKCFIIDEDVESDSDGCINMIRKRRVARMSSSSSSSDDSSDNSDAEVIRIVRKKNTYKLASSEDDSSEDDGSATKSSKEVEDSSSSDSCDGQSEKCPICFIKFRNQEVGTPASCEHSFCVGCIQEWAKSVNTCPVDRKKFNQIRVRKCYIEKDYYKTIPVEEPTTDAFDDLAGVIDLTACEICGSSEHEDLLLLCDGCDAAYHLDCLTPPLREVPVGNWFCEGCVFRDSSNIMNFDLVQFDFVVSSSRSARESFTASRLIPRTRQSERIRTRIVYQRGQRQNSSTVNEIDNVESGIDISQPGPSTSTSRPRVTKKKATKRRKKRKTRISKYKITYEIDETTGKKIAIKKKTRKYRRKLKKRKSKIKFKRVMVPKSVKERLAKQLGMCAPKTPGQTLPDVKVQTNPNNIAIQRSQAGLPSLHLFAPRNELEYFSESESEVDGGGGVNILVARRPNRSDVSALRRAARNKAAVSITPIATTETTDLLGSILNSQAQLHSKNSALSLKKDGTVKIDINKNITKGFPDQNNRAINLGSADSYVHRRPMVPNASENEGGSYNANMNNSHPCDDRISNTVPTSTVEFSNSEILNNFRSNDDNEDMQNFSRHGHLGNYEIPQNSKEKQKKKEDKEEKEVPNGSPGNSGSELDIYSDIETVSTSKVDEQEAKCPTPPPSNLSNPNLYDDNESESDLIIDTEKAESDKYDPMTMYESEDEATKEEETVTSTSEPVNVTRRNDFTSPTLSSEIQSETVQSSNQNEYYLCKSFADEEEKHAECDNEEPSDDCPNFSIYSAESINLAKNSELNIMMAQNEAAKTSQIDETPPSPVKQEEKPKAKITKKSPAKKKVHMGLYSDSEDESLIKINQDQPFGFSDIRNMTEDISEEERSYTPCLDEKEPSSLREGLAGLDTEMISDDDKNDFEETQEMKTASDGDALEINAKESELDFTRPEDCEEGEIVDKSKTKVDESVPKEVEKESNSEVIRNDEIENENKEPVFKKLSKSNKERNYRDKENKERERSKSKDKKDNKSKEKEIREREMRENNRRERQRKEKRREIARYNVRSLVETKPKRDKFGRDPTTRRRSRSNNRKRTPSSSRSPSPALRNARDDGRRKSQSLSSDSSSSRRFGKDMRGKSYSTSRSRSPIRRSVSRGRKSHSPGRRKGRRGRTASRSKSRGRKPRSRSRLRKRPRSSSRDRIKPRKRSNDKANDKLKRKRKRDRSESRSPSRRREWVGRRRSREWTPSMSHSRSPEPKHFTPSWTPPRMMNQTVRPQNLTVILPNDSNKKKKEKKKKQERKTKESVGVVPEKQKKRRRSERSPLPSKEVFASGNNILVSVSFNKDNEVRTEKVRRKRDSNASEDLSTRRVRKENNPVKTPVKKKQRVKNVSHIKPVAIIDLDRSPFKELTPSPKDIIVLSDSDNGDSNDLMGLQNALNQQSPQQAASPEAANNSSYMNSMGPKTPPEPQVKFTFSSKQPQLRAISNPLHDPDEDHEEELDPQEELENRLNEVTHKGPNTPPEPPNSPPSSPDAYDPFDPTKSRTPSPEPKKSNAQSSISQIIDDSQEEIENISESIDLTEKSSPLQVSKSHTPPISVADIQPADSQSSVRALTPDTNQGSSPERSIAVVINQVVQSQSASLFPSSTPITYSSSSTSLITSTPISSNLSVPRINILSSTILTPPVVTSSVSQRSLIPNTTKASPVNKVSPSKAPAKSSASKGSSKLPSKNANWKNKNRSNENNDGTNLDLDSPYSPGSSDYEDLFEPPPETTKSAPVSKTNMAATAPAAKTTGSGKGQNAFDVLFGSSPVYANKKQAKTKPTKSKKSTSHHTSKGTKQVGVKLDEDNLKILDELPNSAVEMQVKDKFLKKLNRQERVVEEVKFVLKPYYNKKRITKEEYKDILRRAVPKICHNKSGEINPQKIQQLIEAYIKKSKHSKKVTSSSSTVNPQKTEVVSNWLSKLN